MEIMEARNDTKVENEKPAGRFASWMKRVSPFSFETLKEFPRPTSAALIAVLFFCLIWHEYDKRVDASLQIDRDLSIFVNSIRKQGRPKPEILVGGSSFNRLGIDDAVLQSKMQAVSGKVTLSAGTFWECHRILRLYEHETERVKLVIVNLQLSNIKKNSFNKRMKDRLHFFRLPGETDYYNKNVGRLNWTDSFLPIRSSIRSIAQSSQCHAYDYWDGCQYDEEYARKHHPKAKSLARQGRRIEKARAADPHLTRSFEVNHDTFDSIRAFVDDCRKRDIFIVFNLPPKWRGVAGYQPIPATKDHSERMFLAFLDELDGEPHCAVIASRDFSDIGSNLPDEELFFDHGHMKRKGASLYTEWLADRMLGNPKIVAAMEKPRRNETFLVKKLAPKGFGKIAGYFKGDSKKPEQEKPAKENRNDAVKTASPPPKNPVR